MKGPEGSLQTKGDACADCSHEECPGTTSSTAPPSFKAQRKRKTKDFIGSEKLRSQRVLPEPEPEVDEDTRLMEDADVHEISAKVASLIFHHIQEGFDEGLAMDQSAPADDEFHKVHFFKQSACSRCWPFRRHRKPTSQEAILHFIEDLVLSLYFCKQVVVLCAIYVERLLDKTSVMLTRDNWCPIVIVSLLISSKVWEDVHPWNADFQDCIVDIRGLHFRRGALFRLEMLFLERLRWEVYVDGEVYARYFFALLEGSRPHHQDPKTVNRNKNISAYRFRTRSVDCYAIDTIIEDEMSRPHGEADMPHTMYHEQRSDGSSPSGTPPHSPGLPKRFPWSWDEMVESWRNKVLNSDANGEAGSRLIALRAKRDAWMLDAGNPYIGALRHAPRAPAPSSYIPQSAECLWSQELSSRGATVFGPQRVCSRAALDEKSANTISGVTGTQLASELQRYLTESRGVRVGSVGNASEGSTFDALSEDITIPDLRPLTSSAPLAITMPLLEQVPIAEQIA